jgi:hypothetical protein
VLKTKWLDEADFTRSYDHSNIVLMRLELVVDELTDADLDRLLDLPTKDSYGNDQSAGMQQFLEFPTGRLVSWESAPEFGELLGEASALVVTSSSSRRTQRQIHRIGAEHVLGVAVREDRLDSAAACA